MKLRYKIIISIVCIIIIIACSTINLGYLENYTDVSHEYGSVKINEINRQEFNRMFSTDIIVLPGNVYAVGIHYGKIYITDDRRKIFEYQYLIRDLIPFIGKHIYPKLNKKNLYFLYSLSDGYGERLSLGDHVRYYFPSQKEFINNQEIVLNSKGEFPLLHYKKYILACCKLKKEKYTIAIPDSFFISSSGQRNLKERIDLIRDKIPWESKKNIAIWRGNPKNGTPNNFVDNKYSINQRTYFVELFKSGQLQNINYLEDKTSHEQMTAYKYLIDIDGWSNTWDATIWKLYSGCIMLKVGGVWEQWYYHKLKEWIHYIPVKDDFSDLNEKILWCIANDDECRQITKNAYDFVKNELTLEKAINYTIDIFKNYVL